MSAFSQKKGRLQESGEDYLERIVMLREKSPIVRSIDLAGAFSYSRPAVSQAVKRLESEGYLIVEKNGNLKLTVAGRAKAESVLKKHRCLTSFFVSLGVDATVAEEDACRIEHVIHEETFQAIEKEVTRGNGIIIKK
jgi:DtxR family transcriptional regulator, Mn-dependent transcriptional regulator